MNERITILGAGLSGCVLAWQLYLKGKDFQLLEDEPTVAGSLIAAGMLAPVTGKAFNPSWKIHTFYDPAMQFYKRVEEELKVPLWHPYPVARLFFDAKDRRKFEKKRAESPELECWVSEVKEDIPNACADHGAVIWKGSGRLNVRSFIHKSRAFFTEKGLYREGVVEHTGIQVYTTGFRGLKDNSPLSLPHRSAKGEILTVRIPGLAQDQILSRGNWIVPTGQQDETFLTGANYEWDDLNNTPTDVGRESAEKGIRALTNFPYEIINHHAGIRPIVRRSEPVIGNMPGKENCYLMNGLGSKGVLYAPESAQLLLDLILNKKDVPTELDVVGVIK